MKAEISPRQAWHTLATDKDAQLVDVRTQPEWLYVGKPVLADLDKQLAKISWHLSPEMNVNPGFVRELRAMPDPQHPGRIHLSQGSRSLAAAKAAFAAGFAKPLSLAVALKAKWMNGNSRVRRLSSYPVYL